LTGCTLYYIIIIIMLKLNMVFLPKICFWKFCVIFYWNNYKTLICIWILFSLYIFINCIFYCIVYIFNNILHPLFEFFVCTYNLWKYRMKMKVSISRIYFFYILVLEIKNLYKISLNLICLTTRSLNIEGGKRRQEREEGFFF
jgi:hypothetical protein